MGVGEVQRSNNSIRQEARNLVITPDCGLNLLIPVVLFATVQRGDLFHLCRGQFKAEQVEILANVIRIL